ncbi:MAG: hypothetical protein A2589_03720 [Candidatus Vogelbacteria bacterium RIFOXYD1_FULL_46_19]|jgi:hypothetical protein|uniref:Uncharacterized protein n=1 Tax=Candidatus Vogelbacteria bacterium RIFOXYD1_FULL_46_19 TaxID=1802439 RepID=A0A1G2QIT7_9BACT|nr:MAG: hypothetical protein A2589_03720 [Candidatus Vogelbacteria bacterium RIFOXYD1_FULL_46_19]
MSLEQPDQEVKLAPTDLDMFQATIGQLKRERTEGVEMPYVVDDIEPSTLTEADSRIFSLISLYYSRLGGVAYSPSDIEALKKAFGDYKLELEQTLSQVVETSVVENRRRFQLMLEPVVEEIIRRSSK